MVLLDQDMPGMTGMRLASKIRTQPQPRHSADHAHRHERRAKIIARNAGSSASWPGRSTTLADELAQRQAGSQLAAPQRSPCLRWRSPVTSASRLRDVYFHKVIRGVTEQTQPATGYCLQRRGSAGGDQNPGQYDLVLMDCEMPVLDGSGRTSCASGAACTRPRTRWSRSPPYPQRAPRSVPEGRHGRSHGQAGGAVPSARADRPLGSRQEAGRARRMMTCRRLRIRTRGLTSLISSPLSGSPASATGRSAGPVPALHSPSPEVSVRSASSEQFDRQPLAGQRCRCAGSPPPPQTGIDRSTKRYRLKGARGQSATRLAIGAPEVSITRLPARK